MDVEDELISELLQWMEKQEEYAELLMKLAKELEGMTEVMTVGQLVGNTAAVVGSAVLVGTGIATLLTGGLAAPLLVTATAGVTAGVGTVTSVTCKLLESWKSSKTMKNAEKTAGEVEKIWKHIESLQEQLSEECELTNDFNEVQCEITARILRAMAKRNGRDLPQSRLTYLLRNDHTNFHTQQSFFQSNVLVMGGITLLLLIGFYDILLKTASRKGAKHVPRFLITEVITALSSKTWKTLLKGTSQVAGGAIGLVLSLPDLIDNCVTLFKHKNQTEASKYLRNKACEICDAVKKIKKQLTELQEMLNEIPETECHIDLATEMCGNQRYTRGIISVESKKTKKQKGGKKEFFFLSTKDMCETKSGDTSKQKSAVHSNNNKKQEGNDSGEKGKEEENRGKKSRLPTITMSNVRSLPNKMEDIEEMVEDPELFASDMMFFTETWLNNNSPPISLDGYDSVQLNRDPALTQKRRGGGMIVFVNKAWAKEVQVKNLRMTRDCELMVVSIIPHNHDDPPFIYIYVYAPGPNFKIAAIDIAGFFYDALEIWPNSHVFLLGDFNRCDMTPFLGTLDQYITCPTRYNNTLDLCYGNVPGVYRSVCRPPLGRSDHNVIHLIPKDHNDSPKDGDCKHDHTKPSKQ
ncbi:uncharacterized protein LOC125146068 [Tachysurus fulvidraco]|uniref:uncharacterized protein LOC125146068 n=1 Tax=Tachysurus fulvidraco TaxID=1234273 RepID=UPI001FED4749|nr:uncharacterized protein LOC125146068 [Tachysurus fulvidraco]